MVSVEYNKIKGKVRVNDMVQVKERYGKNIYMKKNIPVEMYS